MNENRRYVPFSQAAEVAGAWDYETRSYQWWLVEPENMGWCKDGCTKWYHFRAEDGTPCFTLKRGGRPKYN